MRARDVAVDRFEEFASIKSKRETSMLDCEPSETDETSDAQESRGVSLPELAEVHVLAREWAPGRGREKTGIECTAKVD